MARNYLGPITGPATRAAQAHYFGRSQEAHDDGTRDALTPDEAEFIAARDSFYIASVTESGWPYVQHRGGPVGFLRVVDGHSLAFADYVGNRQLISTGNVAVDDRVSLFLMDYPNRTRLKILGHARVEDARAHPELVEKFAEPKVRGIVERLVFVDVVSYDWNCPKYITPRFTPAQIEEAITPLRERIAELEAQLKAR
jgi:uncharacterized protein